MSTAGGIDILVPVLSRPQNARPLVDSVKAHTTIRHTITFICSPGDDEEIKACVATGANVSVVNWEPGPGDGARKWNHGYRISAAISNHPLVMLGADDLEFTPKWDVMALSMADQTGAGVIGTDDGMNPLVRRGKHSTHSLVRRSYIDEIGGTFFDGPGIVYSTSYSHQAVDNELVAAAKGRGEWAFARRSIVIHHHPIFDRSVAMDDTYRRALADGQADIRLFQERLAAWSKMKGRK